MIKNSPCYRMKNDLQENDIVEKTDITEFLLDRITEAQQLNGPNIIDYITKNVQPETLVYLNNPHPTSKSKSKEDS